MELQHFDLPLAPTGHGPRNEMTRTKDDHCARELHDHQSSAPGSYMLATYGQRPCRSNIEFQTLEDPTQFPRPLPGGGCNVRQENQLRSELTNPRLIHQHQTRTFLGSYRGAGQQGLGEELSLVQSDLRVGQFQTKANFCNPAREANIQEYNLEYLPKFGNPQRVDRVVEPWTRGGEPTRDFARRHEPCAGGRI